tara:strand:+ start:671 stop:1048 length:378 start_codon:yes stop_codon:yes gene_type:complete
MEELLKTCPRATNSNFNNYTEEQLTVKNAKIIELKEKNPKMTEYYLDLLYDWLYNKSEGELQKMMDDHKALPESERMVRKEPISHSDPITIEKGGYDPDAEIRGENDPVDTYSREIAYLSNLEIK